MGIKNHICLGMSVLVDIDKNKRCEQQATAIVNNNYRCHNNGGDERYLFGGDKADMNFGHC